MDIDAIISELKFKAIRSSGSGGQHVNKVSSKIELTFDLDKTQGLSEEEKERLQKKIGNRLTKNNTLILQCDESRSQFKNKELVIKRFKRILKDGLKVKKKRKPRKVSKAAIKKRLDDKGKHSAKKVGRKKPDID